MLNIINIIINMGTQGSFGYKIGRKVRLMRIEYDADLLWQTCVREIYILMKHYGSIEQLREAFDNLKEAKNKPKPEAIEKCKFYRDLTLLNESMEDWYYLTRNCQHSFINILDSGYFLNNGEKQGLIFLLDFNTNSVRYYSVNWNRTHGSLGNPSVEEHDTATIDEIMEFDDMPIKTMTEILTEMKDRYETYNIKFKVVDEEIKNIKNIIKKAKEMGGEQNILSKATELLDEMEWERKKLEMGYKYFYHRLELLNLLEDT